MIQCKVVNIMLITHKAMVEHDTIYTGLRDDQIEKLTSSILKEQRELQKYLSFVI